MTLVEMKKSMKQAQDHCDFHGLRAWDLRGRVRPLGRE
jgi:hypothetical protein